MGVVLCQAWRKNHWTVLMGYLTTSSNVRRRGGLPNNSQDKIYKSVKVLSYLSKRILIDWLIYQRYTRLDCFCNTDSAAPCCKLLQWSGQRLCIIYRVFWTISTIKDEKSAAKFPYIKTVSGKVVAQLIAFRVVSIYWQGVAPFPWYLKAKGPTHIGSTCVAHTSPHSAAAMTSLRH